MSILILHCSGLVRVVACSKVDAGVEVGGSLLSAHPFLLCLRRLYQLPLFIETYNALRMVACLCPRGSAGFTWSN